eukprot:11403550-Ditylum_brightwellii.AAC.1
MALGRFDLSGSRIDIVPLCKSVMQMRPTFRHVDALYDDGSAEKEAEQAAKDGETIKFKKKESDRAALARRTSYAYKKASEAGEEWTELMVQSMRMEEARKKSREVVCSRKEVNLHIVTKGGKEEKKGEKGDDNDEGTKGNRRDDSYAYIKSLNYLPMADLVEEEDDQFEALVNLDDDDEEEISDDDDANAVASARQERQIQHRAEALKEVTTRITHLLHEGYGGPTPYRILRDTKYPKHVIKDDQLLLEALSSCAVMVR